MAEKRFYWLKLKENYLNEPKIKKLRKIAGGDTYTIIYLKMQLLSIKNEGIIQFEGIEPTFEEELALKLDEDLDNVKITLNYLLMQGLIEGNNGEYLFIEASNNIGSECQSAERVRRFRAKESQDALQCNESVTEVKRISISNSISNSNSNIFNYWNSKNIIVHRELTNNINKSINKALKTYTEEAIKEYIDRYDKVLKDKSWFFDYKWSLENFLNRKDGISSFTDEGDKWLSYKSHNEKTLHEEDKNKILEKTTAEIEKEYEEWNKQHQAEIDELGF